MDAYTFNALVKVGTPVRVFPNTRQDPPRLTRTRSRATDLCHGLTVVHVDDHTLPYRVDALDVLPDDYPVEA
ncbi:hypothetical protein OH540_09680 [Streptomyces sp. BPPL-273]|uniref:hypothetical protein n=1 Tax=Streptomyces sp. BPPL-273 TaxID=2987533 RepID=UPI0024AED8DC|nr:hypothetical protein [Streptomyces sp. BPPL-273]WHM30293.1 hypothetical protein OH540_09680 [Streptomyces sp. BPPL-273]